MRNLPSRAARLLVAAVVVSALALPAAAESVDGVEPGTCGPTADGLIVCNDIRRPVVVTPTAPVDGVEAGSCGPTDDGRIVCNDSDRPVVPEEPMVPVIDDTDRVRTHTPGSASVVAVGSSPKPLPTANDSAPVESVSVPHVRRVFSAGVYVI